jgi:hypothetical protein
MKPKRSGSDFYFLDDHDDGDFLFSSQKTLVGHAIDNILCFTEGQSSLQAFTVTVPSSINAAISNPSSNLSTTSLSQGFPLKLGAGKCKGSRKRGIVIMVVDEPSLQPTQSEQHEQKFVDHRRQFPLFLDPLHLPAPNFKGNPRGNVVEVVERSEEGLLIVADTFWNV